MTIDRDWTALAVHRLAGQGIGIGPYRSTVERARDDKVWDGP
jgi:hypothetical protein